MVVVAGGILLLALIFGPSLWIRSVMARHADPRPDFPGTGGELARHLLDEAGLQAVSVEASDSDHYDPNAKAVRLSRQNYDGASLTAVAVAAHEVGHALQDRDGYGPLGIRTRVVRVAIRADRIAMLATMGLSLLGSAAISPRILLFGAIAVVVSGLIRVAANLITLPVEFDASFNRALPILSSGGYIPPEDQPAARRILRAAAFTYVAGALVSMLNLMRFARLFR